MCVCVYETFAHTMNKTILRTTTHRSSSTDANRQLCPAPRLSSASDARISCLSLSERSHGCFVASLHSLVSTRRDLSRQ